MRSKLLFAAVLVSLAAALACPRVASAQTETGAWTLCTPGAINACASLQLVTVALYSGAARVGTDIKILMRNLNGSITNDNTTWSGLVGVGFGGPPIPAFGEEFFWYGPPRSDYPAHPDYWFADIASGGGTEPASIRTGADVGDEYFASIAGCGGGFEYYPGYGSPWRFAGGGRTCGGGWATTEFISDVSVDAWWFNVASVEFVYANDPVWDPVYGLWTGGTFGSTYCTSGNPLGSVGMCQVLGEPAWVTPEPVTLSLVATGLLGIAGVGLRRRKKDQNTDA